MMNSLFSNFRSASIGGTNGGTGLRNVLRCFPFRQSPRPKGLKTFGGTAEREQQPLRGGSADRKIFDWRGVAWRNEKTAVFASRRQVIDTARQEKRFPCVLDRLLEKKDKTYGSK